MTCEHKLAGRSGMLFLDHARKGVDVNPEKCIAWLSDTHLVLRHILDHVRFGKGWT